MLEIIESDNVIYACVEINREIADKLERLKQLDYRKQRALILARGALLTFQPGCFDLSKVKENLEGVVLALEDIAP